MRNNVTWDSDIFLQLTEGDDYDPVSVVLNQYYDGAIMTHVIHDISRKVVICWGNKSLNVVHYQNVKEEYEVD
jgi:hypothetical protein